jgi:hypothetical protein
VQQIQPVNSLVTSVTVPCKQASYLLRDGVLIVREIKLDMEGVAMDKPTFVNEPILPLEVYGYESNTAQEVFVLTRPLELDLLLSLEANGYVQRYDIKLRNGQIINGWLKVE